MDVFFFFFFGRVGLSPGCTEQASNFLTLTPTVTSTFCCKRLLIGYNSMQNNKNKNITYQNMTKCVGIYSLHLFNLLPGSDICMHACIYQQKERRQAQHCSIPFFIGQMKISHKTKKNILPTHAA